MSRRQPFRIEARTIETDTGSFYDIWLPRQPSWWLDPKAEKRRASVVECFSQGDLVRAIDELRERMTPVPMSADGVASLVRRQWTLLWMSELAHAKAPGLQVSDASAGWVLYWQRRASEYLAEGAWRMIMELPASIVEHGVRMAMESAVEIEEID